MRVLRKRRGAAGTEYGLLVGLIAVAILGAAAAIGIGISDVMERARDEAQGRRIALSADSLAENAPSGTPIGQLQAFGMAEPVTFALLPGVADNAQFSLSGDMLSAAASFDFEQRSRYTVRVRATAADGRELEAALSISILNRPDVPAALSFAPATLDFQWVDGPAGTPTPAQSVTLSNSGDMPSAALNIAIDDPTHFERTGGSCGSSLAGGASCTVELRAMATGNGDFTGTLAASGTAGVSLFASATGWASVAALTPAAATAAVTDATSPGTPALFTVANSGSMTTGEITVELTAGSEWFALQPAGTTCASSVTDLAAGSGTCAVAVSRIATGNDGVREGTLRVAFANGGSATATLQGDATGWAPVAAMTPATATATVVGASSPGTPAEFTVTNSGNMASGAVTAAMVAGGEWFAIQPSGSCAAGSDLAAGSGSCTVHVARIASANDASRDGTLRVSFANGSSAEATVSGDASGWVSVAEVTPASATAAVEGGTSPGTAAVFTVRNSGTIPSGALSIDLAPAGSFQRTGGTCGTDVTSLAPGSTNSCTVAISRIANDNAASASATLTVGFANGSQAQATVSGAASGFASAVSFNATTGSSSITGGNSPGPAVTFLVTNSGNKPSGAVQVTHNAVAGTFSVGGSCIGASPMIVGGTCTVIVRRTATANDVSRSSIVTVEFANGGSGSATVTGDATGFASAVSLSPSAGTSNITNGVSPGNTVTFTATNSGNTASGTITVGQSFGVGAFGIVSRTCGTSVTALNPGQSCTVSVARTASSNTGSASGLFQVSFAAGGTAEFTVSGNAGGFYTYAWNQGGFGSCSPSNGICGAGTQTQSVTCRRSDNATVADSFCSGAGARPADSQSCSDATCATLELSADDEAWVYYVGGPRDTQLALYDASHGEPSTAVVRMEAGTNTFRLQLADGLANAGFMLRNLNNGACAAFQGMSTPQTNPETTHIGQMIDFSGWYSGNGAGACWHALDQPDGTTAFMTVTVQGP